ncbi:MAG: hypothetical protein HZC03_02680 [Candidatus Lloydbacteria bacterium]|nr:hypothetical protein [Candidatus Lloydbacteria bacterium]
MAKLLLAVVVFCFIMIPYELPRAESPPPDKLFFADKFFADKPYSHLFGVDIVIRIEISLKAFHDAVERAKTNPSINKKLEQGVRFEGLTEYNLKEKTCTIYWPYLELFDRPGQANTDINLHSEENRKKLETLGHEVLHCILGNFHE